MSNYYPPTQATAEFVVGANGKVQLPQVLTATGTNAGFTGHIPDFTIKRNGVALNPIKATSETLP